MVLGGGEGGGNFFFLSDLLVANGKWAFVLVHVLSLYLSLWMWDMSSLQWCPRLCLGWRSGAEITNVNVEMQRRCLSFFQVRCSEPQGSFWQLKWLTVENSAVREIVEIFWPWVPWTGKAVWYVHPHRLAEGEQGLCEREPGPGCLRLLFLTSYFPGSFSSAARGWLSNFRVLGMPFPLVSPQFFMWYRTTSVELSVLDDGCMFPPSEPALSVSVFGGGSWLP